MGRERPRRGRGDGPGPRGPARDTAVSALRSTPQRAPVRRAVLDPNVLVSAVLSPTGTPAALLRDWLGGAFQVVVSPALLAELGRVLRHPKIAKRISPAEARELLDVLRLRAELAGDPSAAPSFRSPDSHDDYLIALAEAARAVLVAGDADLLGLADHIPVLSPRAFHAQLADP